MDNFLAIRHTLCSMIFIVFAFDVFLALSLFNIVT